MIISSLPLKATQDEIDKLKKLVQFSAIKRDKKPQMVMTKQFVKYIPQSPTPPESIGISESSEQNEPRRNQSLFSGGIRFVEIQMEPLAFDNPVEMLLAIKPEITPYKWQFEILMQIAGYLMVGKYEKTDKTKIDKDHPFKLLLPTANGAGKDAIIIAASAVWYAIVGVRNRIIGTSSSYEQIKFQTEPAIRDLIQRINAKFGPLFRSIQFHHVVPKLGSEIKLFATDDPGHAEGYHSWDQGGIMRIVNEAKTVDPEIFKSMSRWTGVTHDVCVSSPGKKMGTMYQRVGGAIIHPNCPMLGKWFLRKVTAFECPHLTSAHIDGIFHDYGIDSPHTKSVIFAEFSDYDEPVIISEEVYEKLVKNPPPWCDSDIGIGLDLAGGGDENSGWVRQGNKVVHNFHFRQKDTDLGADLIHTQLEPWFNTDYMFNADNGGIGQGMLDKLTQKGWNISRRNNQSPAFDKRQFLNLGAEMWHHAKRLWERGDVIPPKSVDKFKEQFTTRMWQGLDTTQGKFALEPKPTAIASGRPSPDRADGYVLCFFSYRPSIVRKPTVETGVRYIDSKALLQLAQTGELWKDGRMRIGRFTMMNTKDI